MEQRCHGTLQVWAEPFTRLRTASLQGMTYEHNNYTYFLF
jgi:hypothetical protein